MSSFLLSCQVDVGGSGRGQVRDNLGHDGGSVQEASDPPFAPAMPDAALDQPLEPALDAALDLPQDAALDSAPLAADAAHLDAALSDASSARDGGDGGDDASDGATQGDAAMEACQLTGAFGVELLFDVAWNETTLAGIVPLLAAGTGQIRMVVRLDLSGSPASTVARLTACGATLPDFAASNVLIGTEYYSAYIPDDAWEHQATMPHPVFGVMFGCSLPGCALTTDHVLATFGARSQPNDVWPGRTGSLRQLVPVDHDDDDRPGITFVSRGMGERTKADQPYDHIPVTWTLGTRASHAEIAFRITGLFAGKVDSCDRFTGVVSEGSVEARAIGCRARSGNGPSGNESDCSNDQTSFLDQNLPNWRVRTGMFKALRLPDDADCAAVRAALK